MGFGSTNLENIRSGNNYIIELVCIQPKKLIKKNNEKISIIKRAIDQLK